MTPQQTKEAAQVMMAAEYDENGRCTNVEFERGGIWSPVSFPTWGWLEQKYRIKPKPELKKGQIIEVSDDGRYWKLRRFSCWGTNQRVFAFDGHPQNDVTWAMWRLPE